LISQQDKEKEFVEHLLSLDAKRFALVFDRFSQSLLGILFQMVKDEEQAQDLLQEVFLKIWNNASTYDQKKSRLFTWMLNVARNTAIDHLRSKQGKAGKNTHSIEQTTVHRISMQPEYTGIKKIVSELKEDQREIIDLAFFEGYSHTEIAEKLNIPLGTVKTRCRNAIRELRKSMQLDEIS
jgi:RNA polymerase sigma-70 factor (ECF subfamily)